MSPAKQRRLLNAFVAAARTGELVRLESLFAGPRFDFRGLVRAVEAALIKSTPSVCHKTDCGSVISIHTSRY